VSGIQGAFEAVAAGDAAAFSSVIEATSARLYRLAARMLGDPQEAEDVLQDAYLRAFDALRGRRFDGRSSPETWLYRIVANASLDALRARRRRRRFWGLGGGGRRGQRDSDAGEADVAEAAEQVSTADRLAAREALRELDAWLAELPPDQRTALVLKELEGLPAGEVAAIMGSSVGAVEQRLVRARTALRRRSEGG
jgi:RNA polymerase sigma-70 factor (ECF subfamily)